MCNKSSLQVTWWVFSAVDHEIRNIHLKKKKCCTCLYSCCELINTHQLDTNDNQMYTTAISSSYLPKPSSWSWCNALPDLTLGRNMMGGAWVHANQMVLRVVICHLKSSSVGAFTWSSLRWFQSVVVWTKKKSSCVVQYLSEELRRVWSLVLLVCLYYSLLWSPILLLA